MGYPVINKKQFYSKFDKGVYHYINNAYRESDDSVRVYKNEIFTDRLLIFQLPDLDKDTVPDNRKNLYQLPLEEQLKLREFFNESEVGFKKITAQLLNKFVDPYIILFNDTINKTKTFEEITTLSTELGFDPFISKSFECLINSVDKDSSREFKNLVKAKEFIDKRIHQLRKRL